MGLVGGIDASLPAALPLLRQSGRTASRRRRTRYRHVAARPGRSRRPGRFLQLHLSGGEPTARRDLPELVSTAAAAGLYSNLITSGVLLDKPLLNDLARAGLDHVQISFQDTEPANADRIGGFVGGHVRKLAAARAVKEAGLALTTNFVVHRQNVTRVSDMIDLAESLGAGRVEIAPVQ